MPAIKAAALAIALIALAMPCDAEAKKKRGKGWKKGAHPAWVHRDRHRHRLERDLAVLIAARPRLRDGSRIVLNLPTRSALPRAPVIARAPVAAPSPRLPAPLPRADGALAQRRSAAVESFIGARGPAH